MRIKQTDKKTAHGFSLIELLIGVAIFVIVAFSIYASYVKILDFVRISRLKVVASALANEQFEIIHNIPYSDVGLTNGIPLGVITPIKIITRDDIQFNLKTNIRNIDDPFDGTIGGTPNDLSPADYKLVEIEITCPNYKSFKTIKLTTTIAPKNLETASVNGAIFIRVFDANGQPIPQANVHIENNSAGPPIIIDETTNNDGMFQLIDAPPGNEIYEITVTKAGYSTEKTYARGGVLNLDPAKPHLSVVLQQVTQSSFPIDKISAFSFLSVANNCAPIPNIDFTLKGSKTIGKDITTLWDVLKYNQNTTTDAGGTKSINNLEWDTYNLNLTDANYDLSGTIPLLPLNLTPDSIQNVKLIVSLKNPLSLLVTVKDVSSQLQLADANVKLEHATSSYDQTLITGRGFLRQIDWSGGAGQNDFIDPTKFFDDDNIDISVSIGELRLKNILGQFAASGELTSSTFDTGSISDFYQLSWNPQDQPPETGNDNIRLQIATNNDRATWNFLGPDGTSATFYDTSNNNINPVHNGDRYLRYKIFLQTVNVNFTPNISEIAFTFSSLCTPSGQVMFSGLTSYDNYRITVSKAGYQNFSEENIVINQPWQQKEIFLNP